MLKTWFLETRLICDRYASNQHFFQCQRSVPGGEKGSGSASLGTFILRCKPETPARPPWDRSRAQLSTEAAPYLPQDQTQRAGGCYLRPRSSGASSSRTLLHDISRGISNVLVQFCTSFHGVNTIYLSAKNLSSLPLWLFHHNLCSCLAYIWQF